MYNLKLVTALPAIFCSQIAIAQGIPPSVETEEDTLQVYVEGKKGNFPHKELHDLFQYTIPVNSIDTISIVSKNDSISFVVRPSDSLVFDVVRQRGKDTLHCVFTIVKKQEHAHFPEAYQRSHQGKTSIEVPKVYELVNIIYALTPTGKTDSDIIDKDTPYYDEVLAYFRKYDQELVISVFDSLLKADDYHVLKMDAYAFDFEGTEIEKSDVYNIVSWGNFNTLEPYSDLLEDFSKKSDFLSFYATHQPLYQGQIRTYRDTIDTHEMKLWLERNFPDTRYSSLKVIFSPLVSGNQSSCNFENNGFKELQAHVNYPYVGQWLRQYPPEIATLIRGNIVFTELNHGYINPESDKTIYSEEIRRAFQNMDKWIDKDKPAGNYDNPYACFNEYMNWALVCLRYTDYAHEEYLPELLANVENMMVEHRGFKKFTEFDQFLVRLYRDKKEEEVLADLYPQIVDWFVAN